MNRITPVFWGRLAGAFVLAALVLLATNLSSILERHFPDPDDALRLLQVRDWLGGQAWFDMTQHRLDPYHGGVAMHWSRLVDMPLAGVILLLRPLLGGDGAEVAARIIVPLATLGIIMALVARIAWQRLGAKETTLACLMLVMAAPLVAQILPMRIDHHGWQIVGAMLGLSGLLARRVVLGAWVAGLAIAASLSISIEGLPLAAVFAGVGALRWLGREANAAWLGHYLIALAAGSLACFAALRGFGDLANHCDQMSPVQLAVLTLGAGGMGLVVWRDRRWPLALRLAVPAVLGVGAGALYVGMAPQCRAGSFQMLSPLVRTLWYNQVAEGLPVWQQVPVWAVQIALPPLFALYALWHLAMGARGGMRTMWRDYALALAGAYAIGLAVARASSVAGAFCAVPLAWLVLRWLDAARDGAVLRRIGLLLGIVVAVQPSAPITLYAHLAPSGPVSDHPSSASSASGGQVVWMCHIDQSAKALAAQPKGLVLAGLDIAPEILLATHHTAMASGHHRGARAMDVVIRSFTLPDTQAHALLRAEHVDYIALCPMTSEAQAYAHVAPQGLAAQLLSGHAPAWAQPIAGQNDPRLAVWRVR